MYLNQNPGQVSKKFQDKFSEKIQAAVRDHFAPVFGANTALQATYEKWVITCQASQRVREDLEKTVSDIHVCMLEDFVLKELLPGVEQWRQRHTKNTTLPADRWLLGLIDQFRRSGLIRSALS